jgi:hypothetical protein
VRGPPGAAGRADGGRTGGQDTARESAQEPSNSSR